MLYVFLADGFEEIEAIAPIDILRRGNLPLLTVGVTGKTVHGAHGITVEADITMDEVEPDKAQALILPGGIPGATNLEADSRLSALLDFAAENHILLCAICAAPMILGKKGFLRGKEAVAYPGYEKDLDGAKIGKGVCRDGNIITAQGAGVALPFAFAILQAFGGDADAMRRAMQYDA